MKALVLGGNGFIGTHLVDHLLENGHQVIIYDRADNKFRNRLSEVSYIYGELGNQGMLKEALVGVDWVFHLVSTTLPKTSNEDPAYDVRSNVADTVEFLEACVKAKVKKVIFSSSGGTIYGIPQYTPVDEKHPTNPISSYGISKLSIEKYLSLFNYLYQLDYAALRISNPYGEYQNPFAQQGAIAVFLGKIANNEPITVWGDGSIVRDYIYIKDAVKALYLAAINETTDKIFNIGSGVGLSLNDILAKLRNIIAEDFKVKYTEARALDVPVAVLDTSRAREQLGWVPERGIEEGLKLTWEWIKKRL